MAMPSDESLAIADFQRNFQSDVHLNREAGLMYNNNEADIDITIASPTESKGNNRRNSPRALTNPFRLSIRENFYMEP